jgi:hypothetical protein
MVIFEFYRYYVIPEYCFFDVRIVKLTLIGQVHSTANIPP